MATEHRLDAARAERAKTTASAAVAGLVAPKPGAAGTSNETVRTNVVIARDVSLRAEERMLELRRAGSPTSLSGLVEVALAELLKREDLADVVRRYGLGLRRK